MSVSGNVQCVNGNITAMSTRQSTFLRLGHQPLGQKVSDLLSQATLADFIRSLYPTIHTEKHGFAKNPPASAVGVCQLKRVIGTLCLHRFCNIKITDAAPNRLGYLPLSLRCPHVTANFSAASTAWNCFVSPSITSAISSSSNAVL